MYLLVCKTISWEISQLVGASWNTIENSHMPKPKIVEKWEKKEEALIWVNVTIEIIQKKTAKTTTTIQHSLSLSSARELRSSTWLRILRHTTTDFFDHFIYLPSHRRYYRNLFNPMTCAPIWSFSSVIRFILYICFSSASPWMLCCRCSKFVSLAETNKKKQNKCYSE